MRKEVLGAVVMIALAWVLWVRTDRVGPDLPASWGIMEAFENKSECDKRRKEEVSRDVKGGDKKLGPFSVQPRAKEGLVIVDYLCLPATNIDPRQGKGKDIPPTEAPPLRGR